MKTRNIVLALVLLALMSCLRSTAFAQGSAFTYQGRLAEGNNAATGLYDLRFGLFLVPAGSSPWGVQTNAAVPVSNGLFTVVLDFGANIFNGLPRWLEIGVRPQGSATDFDTLAPRQLLTATPYAIRAANFSGSVADGQLSANIPRLNSTGLLFAGVVQLSNAANQIRGTFGGDGSGLSNVIPGDASVTTAKIDPTLFRGVVPAASLDWTALSPAGLPFSVTLPRALDNPPTVTLAPSTAILGSVTAGGFAGRVGFQRRAVIDQGFTYSVSLALVNGVPAVAFDNSAPPYGVAFAFAATPQGAGPWTTVTVNSGDSADSSISLAVVNGLPAISYYEDNNRDLKFAIAGNAQGAGGWTSVTVESAGDVGLSCSLAVVSGAPAISYADSSSGSLKFARANHPSGLGSWTIITVDTGGVGAMSSLAIINGLPAISYLDQLNRNLKFAIASNAQGTGPWNIVTVDSAGDVGYAPSLAVVNGVPAISYLDRPNELLKFARAGNAQGTGPWTITTVDGAIDPIGIYKTALAVINGLPAISYTGTDFGTKLAVARNSQGSGPWNTVILDARGAYNWSLATINGTLAAAYRGFDITHGFLRFTTIPDVAWTAGTGEITPLLAAGVAENAITRAQLAEGAVDSLKIADSSITTDDLANGTITAAKFGPDVGVWNREGSNITYYGGNVGINQFNPSARLHVAGTTRTDALQLGNGGLRVPGAGVGASTPVFIHRAVAGNTVGNWTAIDHPLCNNDPNSILLVTPNWNPGGVGGVYHNHPIGVYYDGSRWAIFNQDLAPMSVNAAFNVLVVKP